MTEPSTTTSSPSSETPFTVMVRLLRAQLMKFLRASWDTVSVDLETFPPLLRLLVRGGYAGIVFILVMTLFHEVFGAIFPMQKAPSIPFVPRCQRLQGKSRLR